MSQPNRKANRKRCCHYQHDKKGLESNPLVPAFAPKPDSCASYSSHASVSIVSHPAPTLERASFDNNLVGKAGKLQSVQPFIQTSNACKSDLAKIESDASKNTLLSKTESDAPQTSRPKILSDASGAIPSAVKLSISKAVPTSSPQKQDTDSLVQSDIKSSASSSFPSKSVPSSSPQKTNTVKSGVKISKSKNYSPVTTVPYSSSRSGIMPSLQWVAKSKGSTGNIASISIPAGSPTPKTVSSPICSAKETITALFGPSDTESKASEISQCSKVESNSDSVRSSHPTKIVSETSDSSRPRDRTVEAVSGCTQNKPPLDVSCSLSQRVDTISFVQLDIESNTLESSLHAETVPSTDTSLKPHAVPLPDKSLRLSPSKQWVPKSNTHNSSLLSEPEAVVSSTSPITEPCQNESGETELNDSTNSALTNPEPGQSEIEILKELVGDTQRYDIPKRIRRMLRKNIVPPVLRMSLSPDNYAEYFATLLYSEDIYCQKWSNFLLRDVTLKLRKRRKSKKKRSTGDLDVNYPHVEFKINEVRERRPFLLSRDYVHLVPSGQGNDVEAFNGILSYVRNGTTILAEFKEDFHIQHEPSTKYDVSFSFNRVCLKRAHRAVLAAAKPLLSRVLFPSPTSSFSAHCDQVSPMNQILNYGSAPIPYLIEGRHSPNMLIRIKDTILEIYKSNNESRVLICASKNSICDALARSIMVKVPKFDLFRANAAFREKEEVPDDILPACRYDSYEKCFTIPPSEELEKFRIISSTFVNTFGLHKAGLKAGHFSHIFLVDASSAIEPEVIVALTDLVTEKTVIVATGSGSAKDKPQWVRSDIGRNHGLQESLFKRLLESEPYRSDNPLFVTRISEVAKSNPTRKTRPTRIRPDPSFRESHTDSNLAQPDPNPTGLDIFFWSN